MEYSLSIIVLLSEEFFRLYHKAQQIEDADSEAVWFPATMVYMTWSQAV
jgi:hypothetical protein